MRENDDIDEIFASARLVTRRRYPGLKVTAISLTLSNNEIARLPVPELLASRNAEAVIERMEPEEIPIHQRFTWSADFTSVNWFGTPFTFTGKQRSVVGALIEAYRNGTPALSSDLLLETAESEGKRLRDLFRSNPAWGTFIVSAHLHDGPIGAFQINPQPPEGDAA